MEIYNLVGIKREYIRPTWLTGRGWDRLVSLLTLCRTEKDMDMILTFAQEYVRRSNDDNLDNIRVVLNINFGFRFFTTS